MRSRIHLSPPIPPPYDLVHAGRSPVRFPVLPTPAAGHQHRSTTIVTFLMVFLIQNTQNRDSTALHLKLDELIRVSESARNKLLDLEDLTEAELEHLKGSFTKLAFDAPDAAILRGAAENLDTAGTEIQGAKEKLATVVADGNARKPLR